MEKMRKLVKLICVDGCPPRSATFKAKYNLPKIAIPNALKVEDCPRIVISPYSGDFSVKLNVCNFYMTLNTTGCVGYEERNGGLIYWEMCHLNNKFIFDYVKCNCIIEVT